MRYFLAVLLCIVLYFVIFGGLGVILDMPLYNLGAMFYFLNIGYIGLCVFLWKKSQKKMINKFY